jgi:hypothetical protein
MDAAMATVNVAYGLLWAKAPAAADDVEFFL